MNVVSKIVLLILSLLLINSSAIANHCSYVQPTFSSILSRINVSHALARNYPELPLNFRCESWAHAFDDMHATITREFAYADRRNVDWNDLGYQARLRITTAEDKHDIGMYYVALRDYIMALHDGHTTVVYDNNNAATAAAIEAAAYRDIGGSVGMIITKLDDGRYIASFVEPNGAADQAGILLGAQIITWNNLPIETAVTETPLTWSTDMAIDELPYHSGYFLGMDVPSTQTAIIDAKLRLLVRAPVNTQIPVTFINPTNSVQNSKILHALDDNYYSLKHTALTTDLESFAPSRYVTCNIFAGTYGYIKVWGVNGYADFPEYLQPIHRMFQECIYAFNYHNVKKIVIDLRSNRGGSVLIGCDMSGFFTHDKSMCMKTRVAYDRTMNSFETLGISFIQEPQEPYFAGKVAIITNYRTISSGEIAASGFKTLSHKEAGRFRVFSIDPNTAGSCTETYEIMMPENITVKYAGSRDYDGNDNILIESDRELKGGVEPDEKIPMTAENAIKIYSNSDDVALARAKAWLGEAASAAGDGGSKFGVAAAAVGAAVIGVTAATVSTMPNASP